MLASLKHCAVNTQSTEPFCLNPSSSHWFHPTVFPFPTEFPFSHPVNLFSQPCLYTLFFYSHPLSPNSALPKSKEASWQWQSPLPVEGGKGNSGKASKQQLPCHLPCEAPTSRRAYVTRKTCARSWRLGKGDVHKNGFIFLLLKIMDAEEVISRNFSSMSFKPLLLNYPTNQLSPGLSRAEVRNLQGVAGQQGPTWAEHNRGAAAGAVHAVFIFCSDTCFQFHFLCTVVSLYLT